MTRQLLTKTAAKRARRWVRELDQLMVAAETTAYGSDEHIHWQMITRYTERDGLDRVAQLLAAEGAGRGATRAWWRATLLLGTTALSKDEALRVTSELVAIEDAGGGPESEIGRHMVLVRGAIWFLQGHLARVREEVATRDELVAVAGVVRAARLARPLAAGAGKTQ
jgi:hypothetical protein